MIDFSSNTYQNLLTAMLAQVPDTLDKRDTGPVQTSLGPAAYGLEEFYVGLNQVQMSAFVQTATGSDLDLLSAWASISRYPASAAVRLGVFNAPVNMGSRFSTVNGTNSINFTTTATATVEDPQAGNYYYQLTAETPGTIGNDYSGPILPITSIPSLTSAQITDILVPGDDEETDADLRERVIEALNNRPFGGNIAAYKQYVSAIDGVGGVQVYPVWNGGGTVKLSIIGADLAPASSTLISNVQNAVDPPPNQGLGLGMAPIGAQVTVVAPTEVTANISATLTLSPGYSVEQVQTPVETALGNYLQTIVEAWDTNVSATTVAYSADVYVARVTAALVGVTGVVNATNVQINGAATDLALTETGTTQQIPVLGTVTLSE